MVFRVMVPLKVHFRNWHIRNYLGPPERRQLSGTEWTLLRETETGRF
jgi:hypothetical protein